ncbi:hypothetical protein [Neptunomonas sp. XY-337]|uniref:hypothetical protein n=1 Tax=Neptunomonas sp. XY-337 TaxID=2561897 RepID=UPI0010A9C639|nr:hypothetical protein [Neptunomonas sp. XY-337]
MSKLIPPVVENPFQPFGSSYFGEVATDTFLYRLLHLSLDAGERWYLYATRIQEDKSTDAVEYVLGVFDNIGQAEYFLMLHQGNELKIPALRLAQPAVLRVEAGVPCYPLYAGVYRVGFKSYVVAKTDDPEVRSVNYVQSYKTQYLGEFEEVECCLAIYTHFDTRLRGCSMC